MDAIGDSYVKQIKALVMPGRVVCVRVPQFTCGVQMPTFENQLSSSIKWVPGFKTRSSALAAGVFSC